jgi:pyrroline-5-carboxylate reductase
MVIKSGLHPGQLKDQVCSPGGTTISAVRSLEKTGFRGSLIEAVETATLKARELSAEAATAKKEEAEPVKAKEVEREEVKAKRV